MSDYIYHHGIKGQKWGVRRYQNPDGTLTSMGKARKRAIDVNRNMDAVNDIVKTMSRKDNAGSIKIAEKSGFKLDEASVLPDDPWIKYQYK